MKDLTLEDYIKEYHLEVWNEYETYINRHPSLKIGAEVITLRSGFGGYAGIRKRITSISGQHIFLDEKYLSYMENWKNDFRVLSTDEAQREKEELMYELFNQYNVLNEPKAEKVFEKSWEKGHLESHDSVRKHFSDLVDIIK